MIRADAPKSGETTYHRDGTVTCRDGYTKRWFRGNDLGPRLWSTLSDKEKTRIAKHTGQKPSGRGPGQPSLGAATGTKTVKLTALVTVDLRARVNAKAVSLGVTASQWVRDTLERAL